MLSPQLRQLSHTTDPKKAPAPAVDTIARATQKRDALPS
jgi:hypothetical protein